MRITAYLPILAIGIASQSIWACLPPSPEDAFIGRVAQIKPIALESQKYGFAYDYQFSRHNFAWRSPLRRLSYETPKQWQSKFNPQGIRRNDLVVGLAYTPRGDAPQEYAITTLALVTCKDDVIAIDTPVEPNFGWNRANQSCRHDDPTGVGVLDGFMEEDEAYYLAQLQDKYPTCASLESAFPVVKVNDSTNSQTNLSFWDRVKGWFGF